MKAFFESLRRFFRLGGGSPAPIKVDARSEIARRMVDMIARTQIDECTCGEVYALMDQFAESLERGEDVSRLMPMVRRHLEICTDCTEEFEALLRALQAPSTASGSQ